jgi:hypothetical protein
MDSIGWGCGVCAVMKNGAAVPWGAAALTQLGAIMIWFGADPGGKNNFGVAVLLDDGTYKTECVSFVEQAIDWIREHDHIDGVGIDAPLWWSSGPSGDRKADNELRKYGPVQAPNSLRGQSWCKG